MQPQILEGYFDINTPIDMVVWEGGPCAGKTSGMNASKKKLEEKGAIVLIVPEAATIIKGGGLHPSEFVDVDYQIAIARVQLFNENMYLEMGMMLQRKHKKRLVIMCDRGVLSGSAYMNSDNQVKDFEDKVLVQLGLSIREVQSRYVGVVHLVTAADGAEEYYSTANNHARDESPEFARWLDSRSQAAWKDFWDMRVFANRTSEGERISFDTKIQKAAERVIELFGLQSTS